MEGMDKTTGRWAKALELIGESELERERMENDPATVARRAGSIRAVRFLLRAMGADKEAIRLLPREMVPVRYDVLVRLAEDLAPFIRARKEDREKGTVTFDISLVDLLNAERRRPFAENG